MVKSFCNRVPDDQLRDGLFYAGDQWADTLSPEQIKYIMDFFKAAGWRVIYDGSSDQ